jgi:hypothetical protein
MVSEREFKSAFTLAFLQGPNPKVPRDLSLSLGKLRFDLAGMSFQCFDCLRNLNAVHPASVASFKGAQGLILVEPMEQNSPFEHRFVAL